MICPRAEGLRIGPTKKFTRAGTSINGIAHIVVVKWVYERTKVSVAYRAASLIEIKVAPCVAAVGAAMIMVVDISTELVSGLILVYRHKCSITSRNLNTTSETCCIELVNSVVLGTG